MLRYVLRSLKFWVVLILFLAPTLYLVASPKALTLIGQGATFPEPLIIDWTIRFQRKYNNITVVYKGTGSGAGVKAILNNLVDFAGSDAPLKLSEWEEARSKYGPILHIPETMGGIAIVFNLPGVDNINLTGPIIADIYLGKIEYWDDPNISSINPGITLPHEKIYVIKRADSSGTTYIFTDYLSHVSEDWKKLIGKTKTFTFPREVGERGLTGYGNAGVAQVVQQTLYSIGYVEYAYAIKGNLKFAALKNKFGKFVRPSLDSIATAAKYADLPDPEESWHNVSIVDSPGEDTYPIVSLTYILVYKYQKDPEKCSALKLWLRWILTEGQNYSENLLYPRLPKNIVDLGLSAVSRIKVITNYGLDAPLIGLILVLLFVGVFYGHKDEF